MRDALFDGTNGDGHAPRSGNSERRQTGRFSLDDAVVEGDERTELPQPERERWQPLRVGLLNLYRFDAEEFRFRGGRLLLRGNNGTGKSRVLALTLPFLLDGDASAARVEPDGDAAKRMEWNLLLGRYDDRLGYTWIEFGRRDGGVPRFTTLLCGLRAAHGRGLAQRWFAVTDQRVGHELYLQAPTGQALTRDRLREAIGHRGEVFETASRYRAAVDNRLFALGGHRYEALVDLLIQLRKPQLSRQLDEEALSAALSEALPPLSATVIGDVAEAFRTLEADRDDLAAFEAAADATRAFLTDYRRYAAVAVRRRAQAVTSAHAAYETTQRKLRAAETDREEAATELEQVAAQRADADREQRAAAEAVRTLEASPEMRSARELEQARHEAADAQRIATEAGGDTERAERVAEDRAERAVRARERVADARDDVDRAAGAATDAARVAALDAEHDRVAGPALASGDDDALRAAEGALADAVVRRVEALDVLDELTSALDDAGSRLVEARREQDRSAQALDAARDAERDAAAHRDDAVGELIATYRRWADATREAQPDSADEIAWQLEVWRDDAADRSPVARAVETAVAAAADRLAHARAGLGERRRVAGEARDRVAAEREEVAAAGDLPPTPLPTRAYEGRDARAGAPLWQLVDPVTANVDDTTLAGYEAALAGAGLLDAWVMPDGSLLDIDDLDAVLVPGDLPARTDGGLTGVLCPAPRTDTGVNADTVEALLRRIGAQADAGVVWVAADGRYRVGALHGRWTKPAAEHLGHPAREAARRRRLAELDARLADLDAELGAIADQMVTFEHRETTLAAERDAAPADMPLLHAVAALAAERQQVARARSALADAETAVAERNAARNAAATRRDEAAADLGLSDHVDGLAALRSATYAYDSALAGLWPRARAMLGAVVSADAADADLRTAADEHARLTRRAAERRTAADAAAARRDTLQATVGASVDAVLAELDAARATMSAAGARREELDEQRVALGARRGAAEARITELADVRARDLRARGEMIDRLVAAVDAGLLPVAGLTFDDADTHPSDDDRQPDSQGEGERQRAGGRGSEGEGERQRAGGRGSEGEGERQRASDWSADRAVRTARRIDQALVDVDPGDGPWQRVQRAIHGHFTELEHALLAHDLRPSATFADELFVVTTAFQGAQRSMTELRDLLADETANRRALLGAREREVLENHLIGDVSAQLHELLRAGDAWVAEVNRELERMPTSTGMRLRFAWRPRDDGPSGLAQARRRLLLHHAGWSPEQRAELGAFLQDQIDDVREADQAGTWQQHLAAALDYRRWHLFTIERHQDGQWRRLTRRTHGTGSGGEKALALTVPQFAAAAAHYRSADQHAPRLIMLDEAFVGIDSDMRAKCLGLLEQFDLDLVMTSEREWGCYPTVPALAIAHMATRPGIDAVGISRWVWNGRQRLRDDATLPPSRPPAETGG
ncbi:MAG: TIGR02680 family protein [Actinobacteria bacterium]|nr:TIGR02680 family protein [Actinomycetota bacterium]